MERIAVVGAGLAGLSVARNLRELGYDGSLSIYGNEGELPYDRPPLSKAYLSGELARERLALRPKTFFEGSRIELYPDKEIQSINPSKRELIFEGGATTYDALVLATGAKVRNLPEEMTYGLSGIHSLRSLSDADGIAQAFEDASNVLIIGGGYIGLELAATAVKKNKKVTLVEAAPRILERVAAEPTSDFFRKLHRNHGVDIREKTGVAYLTGNGQVSGAILTDGGKVAADCVIVGIGVTPNTELAETAGLAVNNGIQTNEYCQTSDPAIWAAGDCATFKVCDQNLRLESVGNAVDMGECAARNILGGQQPYNPKPWFWSDQFDTRLQIAGLGTGYDNIAIRAGEKEGSVSHWYYKADKLLAADIVNEPRTYMIAKRLIEAGRSPDAKLIRDSRTDLKALLNG